MPLHLSAAALYRHGMRELATVASLDENQASVEIKVRHIARIYADFSRDAKIAATP